VNLKTLLLIGVGAYLLLGSSSAPQTFGRGGVPDKARETVKGVLVEYSASDDSWAPVLSVAVPFAAGDTVTIRGGSFVWRAGLGKFERFP
jgi:hypothetical protein